MSLRDLAIADVKTQLEDTDLFGHAIRVTKPDGTFIDMIGNSKDVGVQTDVDTGALVAGRTATVTLSLETLKENNFDTPRNVASRSSKPWLVTFFDIHGVECTFKVSASSPDNTLGFVLCYLEVYNV